MMQTVSLRKYLIISFFSLLACDSVFSVDWNGGSVAGPISLDIPAGTTTLISDPTVINATAGNVTFTVTGDAVVKGTGTNDRLFLMPGGNTITYDVNNNLTFQGADSGEPLMIVVIGSGSVVFNIADSKTVCFTSDGMGGGGVRTFVATTNGALLDFNRQNSSSANPAEVKIGSNSCLSYVGEQGTTNAGSVRWFTGNSNTDGCFNLRLSDESCFAIQVYNTATIDTNLELADIDLKTLNGSTANFTITNNVGTDTSLGSLRVINENTRLTEYRANPFCLTNWCQSDNGAQFGFILGANGNLTVNDKAYLDYIGAANNANPQPNIPEACVQDAVKEMKEDGEISEFYEMIKSRNPSAFIIDGINNAGKPGDNLGDPRATINFNGDSAIYFRSGVDEEGTVNEGGGFIIDPIQTTPGAGEYVFDVEGELVVQGSSAITDNSGLHILSLEVNKTGCPVCVSDDNPAETKLNFPQRTFAQTNNELNRYNRAAFLINNRMNMFNSDIIHTDQNHEVLERITLQRIGKDSQPTYVGGERHKLCFPLLQRPTIALYSIEGKKTGFKFHTNAGFTGVDVRTPNISGIETTNFAGMRFYSNGRCIDDGYGRYVIFGMNTGAFSQNDCVFIDGDAHLDVFEDDRFTGGTSQTLELLDDHNNECITEGLTGDISNERSTHTIFLGNNSNITVGGDGDPLDSVTDPTTQSTLLIGGDFFSFETQGGANRLPETSGTTGQGGIFVDQNGTFCIETDPCPRRANISTMITKSGNGVIKLPKSQVFFDNRIGIQEWNLDLTTNTVVIPDGTCLSDYTLDWGSVTKDCPNFMPYELTCLPDPCNCPAVTTANLTNIPCVEGEVNQFQIKRSRLGDMAHLKVDGGFIRELVFQRGGNSAEAPMALIDLVNHGKVGLNSAHRNPDSLETSGVLGINGITIVADGDGVVEANENLIINNVCHILPGPNFGASSVLSFHSHEEREIRVKDGGVLDMSQFTQGTIEFTGELRLIFEPGSRWIIGNSTEFNIVFTDRTKLSLERVTDETRMGATTVAGLDNVRVKMLGQGEIIMEEFSHIEVLHDSILTIGSDDTCAVGNTDITISLINQAKFFIGNNAEPGGVFEIGNAVNQTNTINFTLNVNGFGALFEVNRQGMLGLGTGIANKISDIANNWSVGTLFDVDTVEINVEQGTFGSSQIIDGGNDRASLIAIGSVGSYAQGFNPNTATVLGGGNMVYINRSPLLVPINPTVLTTDGNVGTHSASIFSSHPMLEDNNQAALPGVTSFTTTSIKVGPTTPSNFFTFHKAKKHGTPQNGFNNEYADPKGTISSTQIARATIGYVYGDEIRREPYFRVLAGTSADPQSSFNHSYGLGSVHLNLDDTTGDINNAILIHGRQSQSTQTVS